MGRPEGDLPARARTFRYYCFVLGAGAGVSPDPLGDLLPAGAVPVVPVAPVEPEPLPEMPEPLLLPLDICCAPLTKFCGFAIRSLRTSGCALR